MNDEPPEDLEYDISLEWSLELGTFRDQYYKVRDEVETAIKAIHAYDPPRALREIQELLPLLEYAAMLDELLESEISS